MQALVLTVDGAGNKMTPNTTDYEWEFPVQGVPGTIPKLKGTRYPMSYLSWYIGQMQNRPVVDRTGLNGFWDFTLEFVPDGMPERKGPNSRVKSQKPLSPEFHPRVRPRRHARTQGA